MKNNLVNGANLQKHPGGRPLMFSSVEELQNRIEEYFLSCWTQKVDMFGNPIFVKNNKGEKTDEKVMVQSKPYTITGLAVSLGTSRETLLEYEDRPEFVDTIKNAKERCHNYAEESLFIGKNPTGAIFNLKNNYGWRDTTPIDFTQNNLQMNFEGGVNLDSLTDEQLKQYVESKRFSLRSTSLIGSGEEIQAEPIEIHSEPREAVPGDSQ